MKRFINLNHLEDFKKRSISTWYDKLNFVNILFIWIVIISFFGLIFFVSSTEISYLNYTNNNNNNNSKVINIGEMIYFSFVTSTTAGYGDITPKGFFKVIAIVEIILGLMLLALVTSKLVSIKQDVILGEMYEISLSERVNRLRSSLLLFRQNINRAIISIEDGKIRKREINELYIFLGAFDDTLNEVLKLIDKQEKNNEFKYIDALNTELIAHSILQSFEKFNELIILLEQNKLEWKRDITVNQLNKCLNLSKLFFEKISNLKNLPDRTIHDLNGQYASMNEMIRKWFLPPKIV
ncbi:two pore domain potassium channel family protein [Candidatus Woesearchaeota archaeon]|nr:two pore domain potassium channel family protein [Candidatus Woesearchaeota archaeon]